MARARLLDVDPGLAEGLEESQRDAAGTEAMVEVTELEPGDWGPPSAHGDGHALVGLLLVEGLMARNVEIEAVRFTELIGREDLLRPWQTPAPDSSFTPQMRWEVLEQTRVAVLDQQLIARLARWPSIIDALIGRATQRTRSLAFHLGVCYLARVELRLSLVLWHFADRWGHPEGDGGLVPLDLDHALLARIVGARRAAVTTAVGALQRRGALERVEQGWLLHGPPPTQLHDMREQTEG